MSLAEYAGIRVNHEPTHELSGFMINDTLLVQTDGTPASELTAALEIPTVVFDLALDYKAASRIAIARGDQVSDENLKKAVGFFQALGKKVSVIDDCPGLIVMRIVAMLANEGSDAVYQGVTSPEAVDIAMENGVNYPKGPMRWAQDIGLDHIFDVLDALYRFYGEDRYRTSPLIRRAVIAGKDLV